MKIATWNFLKLLAVFDLTFFSNIQPQRPTTIHVDCPLNCCFFFQQIAHFLLTLRASGLCGLFGYPRQNVHLRMWSMTELIYFKILSRLHRTQHRELFTHTLISKVLLICKRIALPHFLTSTIYDLSWRVIPPAIKVISLFLVSYRDRSGLSLPTRELVFILCQLYLCSFICPHFSLSLASNFASSTFSLSHYKWLQTSDDSILATCGVLLKGDTLKGIPLITLLFLLQITVGTLYLYWVYCHF